MNTTDLLQERYNSMNKTVLKRDKIIMIFKIWVPTLVIVVLTMIFILNDEDSNINSRHKESQYYLGMTVITDKDTLTIVNYSLRDGSFTMSNGIKYDMEYVKAVYKKKNP